MELSVISCLPTVRAKLHWERTVTPTMPSVILKAVPSTHASNFEFGNNFKTWRKRITKRFFLFKNHNIYRLVFYATMKS